MAKCFKLTLFNNFCIFVNIEIHSHNITAFGVSYRTYATALFAARRRGDSCGAVGLRREAWYYD